MSCVKGISNHFLEVEREIGKYLTGKNIERNSILPDPKFFKPSVYILALSHSALMPIGLSFYYYAFNRST